MTASPKTRPAFKQSSTVPTVFLSPDEEPSSPSSSASSGSGKALHSASTSALKATPKSLSLRAGSPQYDPTVHESRAGLLIVPEGETVVEVSDEEGGTRDAGYEGGIKSGREGFRLEVGSDEQQQRDYLAGPDDELVDRMPRPSPLSRSPDPTMDQLDSPAIDSAECTPLPSPSIDVNGNGNGQPQPPRTKSAPSNRYSYLADSTPSRPRPRAFTLSHSAFGSSGSFPATARAGPVPAPTLKSRFKLFWLQLFANLASAAFLALIVNWALASQAYYWCLRTIKGQNREQERRKWDTDEKRAKDEREKVVKDIRYYAQTCGFDVFEEDIETKDGYMLKMFKVECLHKPSKLHEDGRRGFPVLIQHGLFQSCGSFITSEERSLAFWLAEHGDYQVYLGNSRGVFDMGHVQLKRSDPRFWDYNIKELALYDLPAMVDHVRRDTGYDKVAFIGHSQGNATMFCSLAQGMVPELGEKLSIFIALAPAVYAGPLTTGFPFTALKSMKWKTWRRWFGVLDFIPLMRISYNLVPSKPFGLLGYQMFAFLFQWTDANWLKRRKPKMFRFTPSPVSSASIFWWTGYGGFSTRGCVLDPTVPKWFDKRFPPLSIHHGGKDYLVLTEPLLERLENVETDVNVIRVQKLDEGEHCDAFWHIDAVELCFESFLEDIEATRPRYPEEEDEQDRIEEERSAREKEEERMQGLSAEQRRVEEKARANGLGLGEVRRKIERLVDVNDV